MQTAPNPTAPAAQPPKKAPLGPASARKGGLLAVPRGWMTPVFALLVGFLALDVAILVTPFFMFRFTDHVWGSAERMEFLAKAMASALAFGFVASVAAERRNHSPWAFALGHCGFWLALALAFTEWDLEHPRGAPLAVIVTGFLGCVAVLGLTAKPNPEPPPVRGVLAGLCRAAGACGNIWFGIALMGTIALAVGIGTIVESIYTARAAQSVVYRSPWFGAVFFLAGLSMLSATFRKWPFRLEQAGWLTVHTGLALVVIGSMTSFLTTVEGEVRMEEGERIDAFHLSTRTRVSVTESVPGRSGRPAAVPRLDSVADFDLNPAVQQPNRAYAIEDAPLGLVVDRFFGTGNHAPIWHDDGPEPRAGFVLDVFEGNAKKPSETIRLDEGGKAEDQVGFLPCTVVRTSPRHYDAIVREQKPPDLGKIVVRDRAGAALLELPVEPAPGSETRPQGAPATLSASAAIPGTSIKVALRGYYDWTVFRRGRFLDASPGLPWNPSIALVLEGPEGEDARQVSAFFDEPLPPESEMPKGRYAYQVSYAFEPAIDLDGPRILLLARDDDLRFVYVSAEGKKTDGPIEAGVPLPLPMPFLRIVPAKVFRSLRVEDDFVFAGYAPEKPVIRITPSWNGAPHEPFFLPLGASRELGFDGRKFLVSWRTSTRPLGFSLQLHDFHRDFHPGSEQPSSFESYLRLKHPEKFPDGEDIKIDMNHPLRLDGWRLYQARFGDDRTTILQVNRDPGLAIIYPACAVVLLGLIVVLFMKRTLALLRKKLEREGAPTSRHVWLAVASVAAVGIGPVIFSVYVAIRPWAEQTLGLVLPLSGWPAFVFGLSLTVIFPIMVVGWFTLPFHRRLQAALARKEAT